LPTGAELVNSLYAPELSRIVDAVVAQYNRMDAVERDRMWREEAQGRGYLVRDGVPETLMRDAVGEYIRRESARVGSPFARVGVEIRPERSVEANAYEREFRDVMSLMREIGR
jgi:hypothetical protein